MLETEMHLNLKNDEIDILKAELRKRGFSEGEVFEQRDIWLDTKESSLARNEKKLRLRIEENNIELTYKGQLDTSKTIQNRTELNVSVSKEDVGNLLAIFDSIGFPVSFQILKKRQAFKKDGIEVVFDEWPIIGTMVEIEGEERAIKNLANEIAPNADIKSYTFAEHLKRAEVESGKTLAELKREFFERTGFDVGNIEVLLKKEAH